MKSCIPSESTIREALRKVLDPELGVSIVDLGLIYDITIVGGVVDITMTLTTIGCPLFQTIEEEVKKQVGNVPGIQEVNAKLTFDPPWDPSRISEEAKAHLGLE